MSQVDRGPETPRRQSDEATEHMRRVDEVTEEVHQSEEATPQQLRIARGQGNAMRRAVENMAEQVHDSGQQRVGDYVIDYFVEEAVGMYHRLEGALQWHGPQGDENVHLGLVVREATDGRFLPDLEVYATLLDSARNELGTYQQPFLWHPWLYRYGRNWRVPEDGEYTLGVRIEPPEFPRMDRAFGVLFPDPVEVVFEGVRIKTGQKSYSI